jgi:hypothetical protein
VASREAPELISQGGLAPCSRTNQPVPLLSTEQRVSGFSSSVLRAAEAAFECLIFLIITVTSLLLDFRFLLARIHVPEPLIEAVNCL